MFQVCLGCLKAFKGYLKGVSKGGDFKIAALPPQENDGFLQFGPFLGFLKESL